MKKQKCDNRTAYVVAGIVVLVVLVLGLVPSMTGEAILKTEKKGFFQKFVDKFKGVSSPEQELKENVPVQTMGENLGVEIETVRIKNAILEDLENLENQFEGFEGMKDQVADSLQGAFEDAAYTEKKLGGLEIEMKDSGNMYIFFRDGEVVKVFARALDGSWTVNGLPDMDEDGIPDSEDTDIDGDGIPNWNDPDEDGDGKPDDKDGDGKTKCGKDGICGNEDDDPDDNDKDKIIHYFKDDFTYSFEDSIKNGFTTVIYSFDEQGQVYREMYLSKEQITQF